MESDSLTRRYRFWIVGIVIAIFVIVIGFIIVRSILMAKSSGRLSSMGRKMSQWIPGSVKSTYNRRFKKVDPNSIR